MQQLWEKFYELVKFTSTRTNSHRSPNFPMENPELRNKNIELELIEKNVGKILELKELSEKILEKIWNSKNN